MKIVIFKQLGKIYATTYENYITFCSNEHAIHNLQDFRTPEQASTYLQKHFNIDGTDILIDC